ncbi:hypothetical protein [Pseudomonas phage 98PfluR60PP]|uniref:Uncharacterized protein n=1 Tax=Pseudomonas phage 98PfluR60PP TaxID=2163965 RepID=A0A2S1PG29_9CAUD|nr:hypothetical protein PP760_gp92 [Pseudomonas phage 98PfluR60PP]AWH15524.1 hypothetical protein [Pseudomonas phage 98PfluR60PP]
MPQAYEMLSNSTIESEATKGKTVYKSTKHDYGCASDDTRITGVEHISLSLKPDGDYPFFTHPVHLLKEL